MKILLINDNASANGGAEKSFYTLKERLQNIPALEVCALVFGKQYDKVENLYVFKAAQSKLKKLLWRCLFHPLVYWKLRKLLAKIKPDIVHLHNNKQFPISVIAALRGYNTIQTVHDFSYLCPTAQNIHRNHVYCESGIQSNCFWQHQVKYNKFGYLLMAYSFYKIRNRAKKNINAYICPSPLLTSYLEKIDMRQVVYIPPFINQKIITPSPPKAKHFLFAGNLGAHKGTKLLIREFAIAAKQDPHLHLTIAGTGSEEDNMKQEISDLKLNSQVSFIGWQDDLSEYYSQAIALIFCSTGMESFGLTITEAMQHQRPVIGVNFGTSAWLIEDKRNGLLFNPTKPGDLAEKILFLTQHPEIANELGKNGQQKLLNDFNDEETLSKIINIYRTTTLNM